MKLRHSTRAGRGGFTLIEMLMVILIIVILAGLLSSAVVKAISKAREVRNRDNISQLASALENFKAKFGFYPPSRIKLCKFYNQYNFSNPLDTDSVQTLTRMFPRIDILSWTSAGIDWDGTGNTGEPPSILEGDQCLVFFLGGIPGRPAGLPPTVLGFSTSPANPATGSTERIGPFYEFQPTRLVYSKPGNTPIHPSAPFFLTYLDAYSSSDGVGNIIQGAPYAYFSSYKTTNGYNRYAAAFMNSDCATLTVWPYLGAPGKYLNPNSFQIISAGSNGFFGLGSDVPTKIWTPANASNFYPDTSAGRDDQANFYDAPLGIESK